MKICLEVMCSKSPSAQTIVLLELREQAKAAPVHNHMQGDNAAKLSLWSHCGCR